MFNNKVAGTITAEGRKLTQTMSEVNEKYWYELWHNETDLHNILKIKNVNPIPEDTPVSVYGDSILGDSVIKTNIGDMTIEDIYNSCDSDSKRNDNSKEVVNCNLSSLNWTEKRGIHMSKIKNVIRHKVSKKKWKMKVDGKELIVTNDHSLIVFRNGEKMEIKPSEYKKGDKVLILED